MILSLVVAFVEALGVATIMPFVALVTDENIIKNNKSYNEAYHYFNVQSYQEFVIYFGIALVVIMLGAILLKIFYTYKSLNFTRMAEHYIGERLARAYVGQSYSWFINNKSSELDAKILKEVNNLIYHNIEPLIILFSQAGVVLMIFGVLLISNPKVTLVVGVVIGFIYIALWGLTKKRLKAIGRDRLIANQGRFEALRDLFGAIKEIKSGDQQRYFIERFVGSSKKHAEIEKNLHLIAMLPKYMFEAVAFSSLILITITLIKLGYQFAAIAPTLTLFAMAGFKIVPALQQIHYAISHLRFAGPIAEIVSKDLRMRDLQEKENISTSKNEVIALEKLVELRDIQFKYDQANKLTISDINLKIEKNQTIGIVGRSGGGKTTLIDIIMGLLEPTKGALYVDGIEINKTNIMAWQAKIGYVPQNIYILDDSIEDNIVFGEKIKKEHEVTLEKVARIAQLHDFIVEKLEHKYKTRLGERGVKLSGGQRQRIGIARALYRGPDVLILDEATSALDNGTENEVMDSVRSISGDLTVIIIAHRLTTLQQCDVIYVIDQGRIADSGKYTDLQQRSEVFRTYSK